MYSLEEKRVVLCIVTDRKLLIHASVISSIFFIGKSADC